MKSNVILYQSVVEGNDKRIVEVEPSMVELGTLHLTIDASGNVSWEHPNILHNGELRNTNLFFNDGRMGLGRGPLKDYQFDINTVSDRVTTSIHIGDGSYGFSFGNGTSQGFIPEIIGMGVDENDAGLYFMGKSLSQGGSDIPLVIIGGISPQRNRPVLGVTSGPYNSYDLLLDASGILNVRDVRIGGTLTVSNLISIIRTQQETINALVDRVNDIQKNL